MNDKELIDKLRHCAVCEGCYVCEHQANDQCLKELIRTSADRISDLLTELQDTEKRLAQQRVRAQNAELFVYWLCAECE